MNLQQLNNNGQQVWVFIITAVTAILVTAGLWYCFEQINDHKAWQWHEQEGILWNDDEPKPKYPVVIRVAMFVWLVKNGHVSWMLKSGAWWRMLVNDQTRLRNVCLLETGLIGMTAGDYVMRFGRFRDPGNEPNLDPFDPGNVSWKRDS